MNLQKNYHKEYSSAVELFKKNNFKKVIEICNKILKMKIDNDEIHYLMAMALAQLKNYDEAIIEIEKAIELNNKKIALHIYKGNLNREIKNYEKALTSFQNVLKQDSENEEALYWIAATMYQMGQKQSALNVLNNTRVNEKNDKAVLLKAKCLEDLLSFNEALSEYDKLLAKNGKDVKPILAKSDLLRRMFRYEAALELAIKAMSLEEKNINCYLLQSVIYKDTQDIKKSLLMLDAGLKIKPNSEQANFNKSIILLQSGDLKKGWELYEWRWKISDWTSIPLKSKKPLWSGQKNSILYLWPEQGIGDEVMFSSILEDVKKDVKKLIVKIDERLIDIYTRSFENVKFISSKENISEQDYEFHLPIGSLPKFYRNNLSDFFNKNDSYLKTNKIIDEKICIKFSEYKNKRKIGVSWKSKNPLTGLKRSTELLDIINYINDPGAVFVNLQYGDVSSEISDVRSKGFVILENQDIDNMKNIDGLLSLINQCDEVVSIDNSTVHFAGAIGKKTEVLMHESADFRWEMQGNATKWYKSLSLKRNIII
jgi:tetratricopeptide (TPR) repeat protein